MNSLTFIILLIIAIAGISSIVWVRKYYDNTAKNMQQNGIKKQTYGNNVQNNKNNEKIMIAVTFICIIIILKSSIWADNYWDDIISYGFNANIRCHSKNIKDGLNLY